MTMSSPGGSEESKPAGSARARANRGPRSSIRATARAWDSTGWCFSDAVYAIALTLVAVEIGVPEINGDRNDPAALWNAILEKGPKKAPPPQWKEPN